MRKPSSKAILGAGFSLVLFIVLIILVRTVDVAQIGPEETSIGLSHINSTVHEYFGINMFWYTLSEIFGVAALVVVVAFGSLGLIQWTQRKNLWAVDREILAMGGLYIVILALYVFFDKVAVNYRPIIEEGAEHVEASFPSSHTMLICVVMGSFLLVMRKYVKNETAARITRIVYLAVIALTVIGRLICGVHWFTDIIGGCLISIFLLCVFSMFLPAEPKGKK